MRRPLMIWVGVALALGACGDRAAPGKVDLGPRPVDHGLWLDGEPAFCRSAGECAEDEYCSAFGCGQTGFCLPRPKGCDMTYAPVCGCDGTTYGNRCEAQSKGVIVDYEGECQNTGGCRDQYDCGYSEFCDYPGGCGATDDPGRCTPRPTGCPTIYAPVCGCDGKTYGNACEAHVAGTDDDYAGECKGEKQPACEMLLKEYAIALDQAKQCSPMISVEQCTALVTVSLPCGCETFINGLDPDNRKLLDKLTLDWKVLGCPQYPWPCPGTPCAVATKGYCGPNGRCQDSP